jgi:hypothetical protein
MLSRLAKGVAARIGAFLAVFALAAFIAPPIAVALVPTPTAVRCLVQTDSKADHDHSAAPAGVSYNSNVDHGKHSGDRPDHKSTCCGMFSVTALAPDSYSVVLRYWTGPAVSVFIEANFRGLAPEQPNRPPISRLSI